MKTKLVRVVTVLLGAFAANQAINADTTWRAFGDLFTGAGGPMLVIGLIMLIWGAWHDKPVAMLGDK